MMDTLKDFPASSRVRALRLVNKELVETLPEAVPNEPALAPGDLNEREAIRARILEGRRTLPRKIKRLEVALADAKQELARVHDEDELLKKWEKAGQ